ncbi:MAG: WbqC family protein [Bacteroidales bacterium]|nr:WbqC family protein [Bacteroidales bacterium]
MLNTLIKYSGGSVTLPPLLFPGPEYFAQAAAHGSWSVDKALRYDKRYKGTHRFEIADTRGKIALTVPIEKPDFSTRPTWDDVRISRHGEWWDKHMTALESAYGRTPYFEFYISRLEPFFSRDTPDIYPTVARLSEGAANAVAAILDLDTISQRIDSEASDSIDLNRFKSTYIDLNRPDREAIPYHQIRQESLGFIPGLSVLDLIFNLGPEAQLYLVNG